VEPKLSNQELYRRVKLVMKDFPLAYEGFVARSQQGVRLAAQLKEQLDADMKKHPNLWTKQSSTSRAGESAEKSDGMSGILNCILSKLRSEAKK
jgi:hypothetical protein